MTPIINWNLISLEAFMTAILFVLVVIDILLPRKNHKRWIGVLSFISLFGLIAF